MFRALSAHLQEDTIVYMQHKVLSLPTRVRGGLSLHRLSSHSSCVPAFRWSARRFLNCCTAHYIIKLLIWGPDKGCYDA